MHETTTRKTGLQLVKQYPLLFSGSTMNWLTNLLFGNKTPAEPQKPRDTLHTPKQNTPPPAKPDPHARYLRDTLHFAKQQHKQLQDKHHEQQRWQQHYGSLHIDELKKLSGVEFETPLLNCLPITVTQLKPHPLQATMARI